MGYYRFEFILVEKFHQLSADHEVTESWNDPDHSCCGMGKDFFRPEADAPNGHLVLFQFLYDQSFNFGGFEGFCSPTVNQDRRGSNE